MKTLIFSDSHLTHKFNQEFFNYISNLIKDVDQVIINGDFWDAYLTTYNKFIKSEWKQLFPLLKEKNTIYIFGNHDRKKFMKKGIDLFSVEQREYYEFKSGNRDFYVTHGHLVAPTYDNILLFRNPMLVRYLYKLFVFATKEIVSFSKMFNILKYKKNIKILRTVKFFADGHRSNGQYFIFGHSHLPVMDISENFIALGPLQEENKSYCIIEDGYIDLIKN